MDPKAILHKVGDVLNPLDDIHDWVEKKIHVATLRARAFGLEESAQIAYKGMMARASELRAEADALEAQ